MLKDAEPWVDLKTLAQHTGINYFCLRKMAKRGDIPSLPLKAGKLTRRLFKVSVVDAALMAAMSSNPQHAE